MDNHLLRMVPQDIAHFLYKGEGLNKTAIGKSKSHKKFSNATGIICSFFSLYLSLNTGDYLGEKNDFNEQVLKAFVELHDFTNLILVQALR